VSFLVYKDRLRRHFAHLIRLNITIANFELKWDNFNELAYLLDERENVIDMIKWWNSNWRTLL
jgi:hypothetical protein